MVPMFVSIPYEPEIFGGAKRCKISRVLKEDDLQPSYSL